MGSIVEPDRGVKKMPHIEVQSSRRNIRDEPPANTSLYSFAQRASAKKRRTPGRLIPTGRSVLSREMTPTGFEPVLLE